MYVSRLTEDVLARAVLMTTRRIAVVQIWGLGDLIMTLPVIAEIAHRYPNARLSVIVRGKVQKAFLRESELKLDVIDMPPISNRVALFRFFLQLRRRRFDMAYFATRTSPRHAIAMRVLSGVKTIIGDSERFGFIYTHHNTIDRTRHRVIRMLDTLSLWDGRKYGEPQFPISIPQEADADATAQLQGASIKEDRFVVVHPGSGRGLGFRDKRLPVATVHGLIREIRLGFPHYDVVLIFGPDDLDLLNQFTKLPVNTTVMSNLSLNTTIALLSKSAAFVGGDTALGHIAAAFGVPTFTVAGPTNIDESHPFGPKTFIIKRNEPLSCQPCWNTPLHGRCPYNAACMTEMTIEEVYRPLRTLLGGDACGDTLPPSRESIS